MDNILELKSLLDGLIENCHRPKYLHPKTFQNFIFHFQSLGYEKHRFVFLHLDNYLREVEGMHMITRNECAELFNIYLLPVAKIYQQDLGFTPNMSIFTVILLFIAIVALLILLHGPGFIFYLWALLIQTHYANALAKKVQKKVYGLMF